LSDGAWITLGVWDPAEHGGRVPRDQIRHEVAVTFTNYRVLAFFSDVHPWETEIGMWEEQYGSNLIVKAAHGHAIGWDMRGTRGRLHIREAAMPLRDEIIEARFRHDGNLRVRQHVANAVRRGTHDMVTFGKPSADSPRKVDAIAAGSLARLAYRQVMALDPSKRRIGPERTGRYVGV
jgi:hypothetical protein